MKCGRTDAQTRTRPRAESRSRAVRSPQVGTGLAHDEHCAILPIRLGGKANLLLGLGAGVCFSTPRPAWQTVSEIVRGGRSARKKTRHGCRRCSLNRRLFASRVQEFRSVDRQDKSWHRASRRLGAAGEGHGGFAEAPHARRTYIRSLQGHRSGARLRESELRWGRGDGSKGVRPHVNGRLVDSSSRVLGSGRAQCG
jgi:hypothetical protein